jgi:hypothetical protein
MASTPAIHIEWRSTPESSNVEAVGWDNKDNMYVLFKHGGLYLYRDVARQRVVAAAASDSIGKYVHREIIPNYPAVKIETPVLTIL